MVSSQLLSLFVTTRRKNYTTTSDAPLTPPHPFTMHASITSPDFFLGLVLSALVFAALRYYEAVNKRRYPQGPPGRPLWGAAFDVDPIRPWVTFEKWRQQGFHGANKPFYMIWNMNKPAVIVNSARVARDLMDKRSDIYNDRPRFIMGNEIITDNTFLGFMRTGPKVRAFRRILSEVLSNQGVKTMVNPVQLKEARYLVRALSKDPDSYKNAIHRWAVSVMMTIAYSQPITDVHDPIVERIYHAMNRLFYTFLPGVYKVELLPLLKLVPAWAPGAGWKRFGLNARREDSELFAGLYEQVRKKVDTVEPCFISSIIESNAQQRYNLSYYNMTYLGGILFGAGVDTSAANLINMIVASLHHPEKQAIARAQVDAVVGKDRMPNFDDVVDLPYVRAFVLETNRWKPLVPLGVDHAAVQDDEYEGYYFPKGTIIRYNLLAMSRDPDVYEDPDEFRPERWLNADGSLRKLGDDAFPMFGFGRRICPGSHLVENSGVVMAATFFWGFVIKPKRDEAGAVVDFPNVDMSTYVPSVVALPQDFKAVFEKRGDYVDHIASF